MLAFCTGIIASVAGAFYVHWLTRSIERDAWVRVSRIKEWQELLGSITEAYMTVLTLMDRRGVGWQEAEVKTHDALADVDIVLSTRIFIADEVESLEVRPKWAASVDGYRRSLQNASRGSLIGASPELTWEGKQLFKSQFQALRRTMIEAARQTK